MFKSTMLLLLISIPMQLSNAQVLGEMQYEEVDAMGAIPDDPDVSLLIVESTVPHLKFTSRRGIRTVQEKSSSLYYVVLDPGVDYITISSEGYLPLDLGRMNFPVKVAKKIKVTPLRIAEGEGTLIVESTPPGASIRLNDVLLGEKTPATLPRRKSGGYVVELFGVDGYAHLDTTAVVRKGETSRLFVHIPKLVAGLSVTSTPTGAIVVLDGVELGRTPLLREDLTPGEGTLVVLLEGYVPNSQLLRLDVGKTREVSVFLVRETGRIEVATSPQGVEAVLDGTSLGTYMGIALVADRVKPGVHTIQGRLDGYQDVERTVTVEGNRTATVHLTLQPIPGSLYVVTTPSGAEILLDEKDTGVVTPGRVTDVVPGLHTISLRRKGFKQTIAKVTIVPGETETVTFTLKEQRGTEEQPARRVTHEITWTKHTIDDACYTAFSVSSADVDGDGDLDVLGAAFNAGDIIWWTNVDGAGMSWTKHKIAGWFGGAASVSSSDMDGDGDLDVLGAAWNAADITWWANVDGFGGTWKKHRVFGSFYGARSVSSADVDGDGDMDVLGAAHESNAVTWWENVDGSGADWREHTVDTAFKGANSVSSADVDGDGDLDLLGAADGEDDIVWWENADGSGARWTKHTIDARFNGAVSISCADVDGDNDLDVLGAASDANDITWWENTDGAGTRWTEHTIDGEFAGAKSVHTTDMDADGDMDVLGTAHDANEVTWWENANGAGTNWTKHIVDGALKGASSVYSADVDGDGDVDVLGTASAANAVIWWESDLVP